MRKKKRRFRHLLHKHQNHLYENDFDVFTTNIPCENSVKTFKDKDDLIILKECLEFYDLGEKLSLTKCEINTLIHEYYVTNNIKYYKINKVKRL